MRVLALYKWARDAEAATVRADGRVDWGGAKMVPGDDDHAALAVARTLGSGGEVLALTIGDGDASWALARGIEAAVSVSDAPYLAEGSATAAILAAAARHVGGADVVVIGDSDLHPDVPAALAGLLGLPALLGVSEAKADGSRVMATRRTSGTEQVIWAETPVLLGVVAAGEEPKPPGMMQMVQARKKPVTTLTLADLGWTGVGKVTSLATRPPDRAGATMMTGTPEEAATALVTALRADGVL
jgi:electron transfer flavoprotein beta subunit